MLPFLSCASEVSAAIVGQKIETAERTEAVASLPRRLRVTERISAA
jgi:hypothetical protein